MRKVLIVCCILLGLGINLQGQNTKQPPADSIVTIETEEFEEDTVSTYSKEIQSFSKGNLITVQKIQYVGKDKWSDSTETQIFYVKGKKQRELSRTVSNQQASFGGDYTNPEENFDGRAAEAQLRVYTQEKLFLDSMVVSKGYYKNDEELDLYIDTSVYCFNNRFLKYSASRHNDLLAYSNRKDYLFDKEKKLIGFITVVTNLTGSFTCKETVLLTDKDTLPLERSWLNERHVGTSNLTEKWTYSSDYQLLSFTSEADGKLQKQITHSYYPNGDPKSKKTIHEDGRVTENLYWWKHSPNRREMWTHLEGLFSFERKGEFYNVCDTSITSGKKHVKMYEFEIKNKAAECTAQVLDKREPYYHLTYDEKNRIVYAVTRDVESGQLKSRVRYTHKKQ